MSGTGEADATAPARRGTGRQRVAVVIVLVLLAALLVLWLARRPIAQGVIDRELTRRGVPARYTIADLGFGRQRLTGVVIGDPTRPDLIADWVETDTTIGLSGPRLSAVRAGRVRLRGRIVNGRLSLGSLDRLMAGASGKGAALPAIRLDLAAGQMLVGLPDGDTLDVRLAGAGRLDGGFRGRMTLMSERLAAANCVASHPIASGSITVARGEPSFAGTVRLRRIRCKGDGLSLDRPAADLRVTLGAGLNAWRGDARLYAGASHVGTLLAQQSSGAIDFAGASATTRGRVQIAAQGIGLLDGSGRARLLAISGAYRLGRTTAFDGDVRLAYVALSGPTLAKVARWKDVAAGTPAGPLGGAFAQSLAGAGRMFDAEAQVAASAASDGVVERVRRVTLRAATGARASWNGEDGLSWSTTTGLVANGVLDIAGGGLPRIKARWTQRGTDTRATLAVAPYRVGGAELALAPTQVTRRRGKIRIVTTATLSGPLPDGRVEALRVPVDLRVGSGRWTLGRNCLPIGWRRVDVSGLTLDPATLRLCPTGVALVAGTGAHVAGGGRIGPTRLTGRLGTGSLDLTLGSAVLSVAGRGIIAQDVALRLGDPASPVRLTAARLDGRAGDGSVVGRFEGAGGRIGAVPLLLSGATGDWRFAGGRLALAGALRLADTAMPARFNPLAAREVALSLAGGAIHATGTMTEPTSGTRVATVAIDHALASGRGDAVLRVEGIDFTPTFQPDRLTPLTYGVIADVRGTMSGDARIAWTPEHVASTGTFRTAGMDLAAAFGPVTGLATEIRFTDLLSLESAPGQVATVASINPGIPVENGAVRYRTLPDARVQVEGARWPFAGGSLSLEPTLLDFGTDAQRHMTFAVEGVAADRFLQQFDFKNLDATGMFDGTLPMIFDASGGRIEGGRLAVRPGGGSLAYLGEISRRNLGFWGNLAFGALRSLRYRDLSIEMNGPLAGEMVTDVHFSGVTQGQGATSNFLIRRLQRLPFVFNVRITAPFRGLIDSAQGFYDPKRLIDRNLPALLDAQERVRNERIQPPASEKVP